MCTEHIRSVKLGMNGQSEWLICTIGGSPHVDKKFHNVNIINFENVDKPPGGGSDNVDKIFFVNFGTF